jgi:hypothetical protein
MSRSSLVACRVTNGPGAASVVSRGVAPILHGQAEPDGQDALAEGGPADLAGVTDPLRPRLQRRAP